jgi:hypothetical protein
MPQRTSGGVCDPGVPASSNAFLGSQYLLVRGLRTFSKLVQHRLSNYYLQHPDARTRRCRRRRYWHLWTSRSTSPRASPGSKCPGTRAPTGFGVGENRGVAAVNVTIPLLGRQNGIFWYDLAIFGDRSPSSPWRPWPAP